MKNFIYIFVAILTFSMTSCQTDVPETDTIPPTFLVQIRGDGFYREFTQDDNYESFQLNLRNDQTYSFTYTSGDADGVQRMQWQYAPSESLEFENPIDSPWTVTHSSSLSTIITWNGDRANPITGNIFTNRIQMVGQNISTSFRFFVSDFGGESGSSNSTAAELNIYIGDHPTEIIAF